MSGWNFRSTSLSSSQEKECRLKGKELETGLVKEEGEKEVDALETKRTQHFKK